jgi:hypothetical protein
VHPEATSALDLLDRFLASRFVASQPPQIDSPQWLIDEFGHSNHP